MRRITLDDAFARVRELGHGCHDSGSKIMFIGNGGSAGIASHMAIDFSKTGGMRAMAFNDGCGADLPRQRFRL